MITRLSLDEIPSPHLQQLDINCRQFTLNSLDDTIAGAVAQTQKIELALLEKLHRMGQTRLIGMQ